LLQPNRAVDKIAPCAHGGIDHDELKRLGISPETMLDFSVSCNPFGPPPNVTEALAHTRIDCYPDSTSSSLRQVLATKLNTSPENIIIGSGSTELIRLLAIAYFGQKDTVLIPQPVYGEYEISCRLLGAQVLKQTALPEKVFKPDIAETIDLIRKHKPKAIFLCNPNNPTGQYLTRAEMLNIMSNMQDGLVILDEAYIAFTRDAWSSVDLIHNDNVVIVRSMTKDYALTGLRLGYAIATEQIISTLNKVKPPWNVSTPAQEAGDIALYADNYLEECNSRIQEAKDFLTKELESLGLSPMPSQTNFFLVKVGNATEFRRSLLKYGILIRDCTSFGLPDYIRLAPRTLSECHRLLAAIRKAGVHAHVS